MDETIQSELENILQKFEENIKERDRKWEETRENMEKFQGEYNRVKEEVIRPTM